VPAGSEWLHEITYDGYRQNSSRRTSFGSRLLLPQDPRLDNCCNFENRTNAIANIDGNVLIDEVLHEDFLKGVR